MEVFAPTQKNFMGCSSHSITCAKQTLFDGVVAVTLYALMTFVADRKIIPLRKIAFFSIFWVPIVFITKFYRMESSEQFARVAFWSTATKVFELLK